MKTCPNCGAENSDSAKFCGECATALSTAKPIRSLETSTPAKKSSSIDAASLARSILKKSSVLQGKRKADVMFVLDCTGSMQGEIDAIRDAITGFADTINSDGVRVRVGLIEFRDRLIEEEHRVVTFAGEVFTNNPDIFRQEVAKLKAGGGGDEPESSLDALMLALRQPFATDSNKVIVLITDAPPHIPDKETGSIEKVVTEIQSIGIQQLYLVMRTTDSSSQIYLKLLEGIKGMAFDLGNGDDFRTRAEHFRKTLMALGKTISVATR
ncbi:MAG: VWA domain-containing protein [Richelia sp. RM2_1_2]|nr:VWA domain-containing protein [Richelia sp. RM2_1_2]